MFEFFLKKYFSGYQGLPIECLTDIFFNLLNAIAIGVCFFLSLYFVDILHFDMVKTGLLMSCYGIGTILGGIISGKLCDRYSAHFIAILCLLLQSSAFLCLVYIQLFLGLSIVMFFLGVSNYGFKTANNVSMLRYCEDKSLNLKALTLSHVASNLGLGLSSIIIGWFIENKYTLIFYVAFFILFFSANCLYFLRRKVKFSVIKLQNKILPKESASEDISILILALLSTFFIGMIITQLGSTYPIYVKEAFPDLAIKAISILFILDTLLIVLFQAPLSNYYSRFNPVLVMGLGGFCMGLGMLILSFSFTFILAICSCCIFTFGEMLFIPTAQLLCYEHNSPSKKGQSIGIFESTYAMSAVIGPMLGGVIYSYMNKNAVWHLSFLLGVGCLIFCIMSLKRKHKLVGIL